MLVGIGTTVAEASLVSTGMIDAAEIDGRSAAPAASARCSATSSTTDGRPVETELDRSASSPCRSNACGTAASSPSPAAR